MKKLKSIKPSILISGGVLILIALLCACASLSPYDPNEVDLLSKFAPISSEHILGTDDFGRDVFTRLLYGGRISLLVGFLSMAVAIVFGTFYGLLAGASNSKVDAVLMRTIDVIMSIPNLLIIILLNVYFGSGVVTLVLTIGFLSWMPVARIVRAEVLSLRERDFILASKGLGANLTWLMKNHYLKNVASLVLVSAANSIATSILIESAMSYLGFGISAPNASWGGMLESAQSYMLTHPDLAVYPGVCILIVVLCFFVFSNGLKSGFKKEQGGE